MRLLVFASVFVAACGPPANQVHGSVQGQSLNPKTVLTFQIGFGTGGVVLSPGMVRADTIVALYDRSGGCELLDQARATGNPTQLWLDVGSSGSAIEAPALPALPSDLQPAPHSALWWPSGAGLCAPIPSMDATVNLDKPKGELEGTFDVIFPSDTLTGSFHATPCGAPPPPRDCL
jgi:hypothetical protein